MNKFISLDSTVISNSNLQGLTFPKMMQPSDQEILDYEKLIKLEEMQKPLISEIQSVAALRDEYENNPPFYQKIQEMQSKNFNLRFVRKDGNCFYRAFAYKFCEILQNSAKRQEYMAVVTDSINLLISQGYEKDIVEDFREPFLDAVKDLNSLSQDFNFDTVVCYLRILTAAFLKKNSNEYQFFVSDYGSMEEFIKSQVEPMNIESDEIHIVSLSKVLGVAVKIYSLNSEEHIVGEGDLVITLLYRPGHYDVLYE